MNTCPARRLHNYSLTLSEMLMEIQFRHDVDKVLEEAKRQKRPVLLDFSAAPM